MDIQTTTTQDQWPSTDASVRATKTQWQVWQHYCATLHVFVCLEAACKVHILRDFSAGVPIYLCWPVLVENHKKTALKGANYEQLLYILFVYY